VIDFALSVASTVFVVKVLKEKRGVNVTAWTDRDWHSDHAGRGHCCICFSSLWAMENCSCFTVFNVYTEAGAGFAVHVYVQEQT